MVCNSDSKASKALFGKSPPRLSASARMTSASSTFLRLAMNSSASPRLTSRFRGHLAIRGLTNSIRTFVAIAKTAPTAAPMRAVAHTGKPGGTGGCWTITLIGGKGGGASQKKYCIRGLYVITHPRASGGSDSRVGLPLSAGLRPPAWIPGRRPPKHLQSARGEAG
jgi:hypothetical protein